MRCRKTIVRRFTKESTRTAARRLGERGGISQALRAHDGTEVARERVAHYRRQTTPSSIYAATSSSRRTRRPLRLRWPGCLPWIVPIPGIRRHRWQGSASQGGVRAPCREKGGPGRLTLAYPVRPTIRNVCNVWPLRQDYGVGAGA